MKRQLRNSYQALLSPSDNEAHKLRSRLPPQLHLGSIEALAKKDIPRKLPPLEENYEVLSAESKAQPLPYSINQLNLNVLNKDARPIVVTETRSPYRIVAVNKAWEDLCGYTREECQGRSVGALLQGPETDMKNVMALLSRLLVGEQAEALLTNYTKNGRKFKNRITVGPIFDEMGKTVNFVGVLREVKDDGNSSVMNAKERIQLPFMS